MKCTSTKFFAFFIFFISTTVQSEIKETPTLLSKFTKPTLDIELSIFSLKEDALLSRGSSSLIEGRFSYLIEDDLKLNFWPVASFISGQQSSRDPQSPLTNSLYLKEASLEKKIDLIKMKMGTLYQKEFLPAMSGQTKAFPSFGLIAPFDLIENHILELRTQFAVPTSSGLATTTTELESNSTLLSATMFLKSSWSNNFNTQVAYTHFIFNSLSSAAATDSLQRGNSVIKVNSSSAFFIYKYKGDEIHLLSELTIAEMLNLKIKGSFIKNTAAPKDLNSGYFLSVQPGVMLKSRNIIRPIVEYYHVQSDAMVAVFSDTAYGRENREGTRLGINYESSKYDLQLIYASSKLIQNNPFQSSDKSIFINLTISKINL
jgi:hypothetical protein